jgi:hypothetical protein
VPYGQEGVLVTGVAPWSTAGERGIRAGDLVLKVQMTAVRTPQASSSGCRIYAIKSGDTFFCWFGTTMAVAPLPCRSATAD